MRGRGLPLRADTHADNKVMQHLLEKNGFVRCGNITLADGTSRIAYHCTVPPRGGKQQTAAQAAAALAQAAKALPKPADGPLLVALMAAAPRAKPPLPPRWPGNTAGV